MASGTKAQDAVLLVQTPRPGFGFWLFPADHVVAALTQATVDEAFEGRTELGRLEGTTGRTRDRTGGSTRRSTLSDIIFVPYQTPGTGGRTTDNACLGRASTDLAVFGPTDTVVVGESHAVVHIALGLCLADSLQV